MNTLEYSLPMGSVKKYMLDILSSGCCPALLAGSYYEKDGMYKIVLDRAGTRSLFELLNQEPPGVLTGFRALLKAVRRITEASALAEDYLIPMRMLSFSAEDIFFDAESGNAKLLFRPGNGTLEDSIMMLCREISARCSEANSAMLTERLKKEALSASFDASRMLRLLSGWELELMEVMPYSRH